MGDTCGSPNPAFLHAEIEVARPPEPVFEAWAAPEGISSWWVDSASVRAEAGATVEWSFRDFGMNLEVEVATAEPPRALVFEMAVPDAPPHRLAITLTEIAGGTRVAVEDGPWPDTEEGWIQRKGCESGWALALATLRHRLEQAGDHPRTHIFVMRPEPGNAPELRPFQETGAGLDRWLTRGAERASLRLDEGAPFRMEAAWGEPISGRVVVRTPDELMVTWTERDGLLTLKSFATPAGRAVGLDLSAWPLDDAAAARMRGAFDEALDRLVAALG